MSLWILEKYDGTSVYTEYAISALSISFSLSGLNVANLTTYINDAGDSIEVSDGIRIKFNGTTMFNGYVETSKQSNVSEFQLTVVERANELQTMYIHDDTDYLVPIANIDDDISLAEYMYIVLNTGVSAYATGWNDEGNASAKTSIVIPNTSTAYPSVLFKYSNCYEGIMHMIDEVAGLKFRFDYDQSGDIRSLRYGTITSPTDTYTLSTNVVDISSYVITNLEEENVTDYALDKVIVLSSNDSSIIGSAVVSSFSNPPKTLAFNFSGISDVDEANAMAESMLAQRNTTNSIRNVEIPVGYYDVREGDYVTIDSNTYVVTKMVCSLNNTRLSLNGIYLTVWQQLALKQKSAASGIFEGVDSVWDGGKRNVYLTDGTEYKYSCNDIDKIGDTFEVTLDYDVWDNDISVNIHNTSVESDDQLTTLTETDGAIVSGDTENGMSPAFATGYSDSLARTVSGSGFYTLSTSEVDLFTGSSSIAYLDITPDSDYAADFGLIDGSILIIPKYYQTNTRFTVTVKIYQTGSATAVRAWYYELIPTTTTSSVIISTEVPHTLNFSAVLDGFTTSTGSPTRYYKMTITVTASNNNSLYPKIGGVYANIRHFGVHSHGFDAESHVNGITDAAHDHDSPVYLTHSTTSGYSGSGCTSPSITVTNGDSVVTNFPLTGSGVISITEDIKLALSNGDNIIKVNTGADCSVVARANYISY